MPIERRIVTVLFADLVDFTSLAERLDAEDVAAVQDAYFGVARETIERYGGSLEKFIGDAVMAAFGLGRTRDDDAERAVRAALALVNGIGSLAARLGLAENDVRIRVGINTGEAVVTSGVSAAGSGSESGRVTGDTVNVASRLQAAAPPGGVLVGEVTALAVAETIDLDAPRLLTLKGKADQFRASLVRGILPEPSRALAMGGMVAATVGRDEELARLRAGIDRTRRASRILVVAPPGVGKSRLVGELTAVADPVRWWRTRCRQQADAPFAIVRDLLAVALDGADADSGPVGPGVLATRVEAAGATAARARVVEAAAEELLRGSDADRDGAEPSTSARVGGSTGGVASVASGPARLDRDGLFAAWTEAIGAIAGSLDVRWLIEDLHWATADEIAFVEHLAGNAAGGVAVVATARPSIVDRIDEAWERIDLTPLAATDAAELVRGLVGDALPEPLVGRIAERSDGNPLFIEELLRTWVSVGTLRRDEASGSWRLTTPAEEIALPTTIQAIYTAQLDDLPASARATARRASVAGRRFPAGALRDLDEGDHGAALAELARRAIIAGPASEARFGDTYAYRHALVRDAAYASLARAERAELHLRLAHWLIVAAGDHPEAIAAVIADHYAQALATAPATAPLVGGPSGLARAEVGALAASWLERAGVEALRLAAHQAAHDTFARALEFTPGSDLDAIGHLYELMGDSLLGTGSLDEASAAYQRSVEAMRASLRDVGATSSAIATRLRTLARAGRSLGTVRWEQARFADMLALAADLRDEFPVDDSDAWLPLELVALQGRMGVTNDATIAQEAAAIRVRAGALGDERLALDALRLEVSARGEAGLATVADWRDLAERLEAAGRMRESVGMLVNIAAMTSDERAFADVATRIDELSDAHHLTESRAWIANVRASRAFEAGAWDEAWAQGLDAIAIATSNAYHRIVVRTWFVLRPIAGARGHHDALVAASDWFVEREREAAFPDSPYARIMRLAFDLDAAAAGTAPRALPEFAWMEAAFGLPYDSGDWLTAVERVVAALLEAGRVEDAERAIGRVALAPMDETYRAAVASRVLLEAWIRERHGDPETVRIAREGALAARGDGLPWWELRLLGVVQRSGAATDEEAARSAALAARLGIEREVP